MMHIAICDDQITELERTYSMAEKYKNIHPELDISLRKFQSSYDLLDAVSARGRYDIYLLDILMPTADGITVGTAIRERDSTAGIIYLTSSPDYAVQSYQVDAGGYLLKPFSEQDLYNVLDKLLAKMDAEDKKRLVLQTSREGTYGIPYSRLLYLEYYQHRLIAHTTDKKALESICYRESFEELTASLTDSRFLRIAASQIVNMQHVQSISSREVRLAGGEKLNLSRLYAAQARNHYLDFLLERGD